MTEFSEYPITMAHPGFQAAKSVPVPGTQRVGANGHIISQDYQGTPERYGPVTAGSPDEVEYYAAQGYEIVGKSDPAAYATSQASAPPPDYEPVEFPQWVHGVLCDTPEDVQRVNEAEAEADATRRNETATQGQQAIAQQTQWSPEMAHELEQLRAQLAAAQAPKNKGGRPRKAPAEAPAEQHA